MILAGDIGGTKTRLALFEQKKKIQEIEYVSKDFSSLEAILTQFNPPEIIAASFGISGPIVNGKCHTTNLPWTVELSILKKKLGIPAVYLLNDLQATAYSVEELGKEELFVLNEGKMQEGNRAVIAAGTGLGEAGLFWDGKSYHPSPSEGGHVDFAPRDEFEDKLLKFLRKKYQHVSYERVVSGMGIENIFWFLVEELKMQESIETRDFARQITEKAVAKSSPLCEKVLQMFISLYGSAAGNLALKWMAVGGVYLGGGIAPKILPLFKESDFLPSFEAKGRFSSFLKEIPIYVILNDRAPLIGAAVFARRSLL